MKKIALFVLAFACALCCMFGLAACGNGGGNVAVTAITLNKTELTLEVGGEETLTAEIAPADATDKTVAWTSDHPDVAKVENGKVTALKAGSAKITAAAGGKSATCAVTVTAGGEVTENEWREILGNTKNFTLTNLQTYVDAGNTVTETIVVKFGGGIQAQYLDGIAVLFCAKEEGICYLYNYDSEHICHRQTIPENMYDAMMAGNYSLLTMFADCFGEFTYDGNGVYKCGYIDMTEKAQAVNPMTVKCEYSDICITFKDGKLAALTYDVANDAGEGGKATEVHTVSDIGTTTIELPDDYVDAQQA